MDFLKDKDFRKSHAFKCGIAFIAFVTVLCVAIFLAAHYSGYYA